MAYKLSEGFEKATSSNLPKMTAEMLACFFRNTQQYVNPETRNVKTIKSMRPEYGDAAVEYVQLKRTGNLVELRAAVCPETNIRQKSYNMFVTLNTSEVLSVQCLDCKGSNGGCKHTVAFVAWLHRRSEEPSPTEVQCYWKKSRLANVGLQQKTITAKELAGVKKSSDEGNRNLNTYLDRSLNLLQNIPGAECNLLSQFQSTISNLSMHSLMFESIKKGFITYDQFLNFVQLVLNKENLANIAAETVHQSECVLWRELRLCRITASKVHEVAQCTTAYGTLVKLLLGATKIKDNKFLKRGRDLEPLVLNEVQKLLATKINKTGLVLHPELPLYGASPDGITKDFVIEVKCPFNTKTEKKYLDNNNQPALKHKLQILLQMKMCQKQYGFFCVADSNFENSNKVTIVKVNRNDSFLMQYIEKANKFWEENIFSRLKKGALYGNDLN